MLNIKNLHTTILISVAISLLYGCSADFAYREEREKGQVLIDLVEKYQVETGQLPNDWRDINFGDESGIGPFYEKTSDNTYRVYFCIGFDEYYIYQSRTKKWRLFP